MAKETQLQLRISKQEKEKYQAAAEITGLSVSAWARMHLLLAAHNSLATKLPESENTGHEKNL